MRRVTAECKFISFMSVSFKNLSRMFGWIENKGLVEKRSDSWLSKKSFKLTLGSANATRSRTSKCVFLFDAFSFCHPGSCWSFQQTSCDFPKIWDDFPGMFFDFSSSQLSTDNSANGSWVDDSCWWWVNLQGHRHGKLEFLLQLPSSQLGSRCCLVPTSLLPTTSGQVTEDQLPSPPKKNVKNSGFLGKVICLLLAKCECEWRLRRWWHQKKKEWHQQPTRQTWPCWQQTTRGLSNLPWHCRLQTNRKHSSCPELAFGA